MAIKLDMRYTVTDTVRDALQGTELLAVRVQVLARTSSLTFRAGIRPGYQEREREREGVRRGVELAQNTRHTRNKHSNSDKTGQRSRSGSEV